MALQPFAREMYATYEPNHVSYPEGARVFAQLPLSDDATVGFSEANPAQNGMWLVYDYALGAVRKPKNSTEPIMILFSSEKEYNQLLPGMKYFRVVPGEFYPRMGAVHMFDIYTSNCFSYDDAEFATQDDVEAALEGDLNASPLYLIPSTTGEPQLTATIGTATTVAKVVKYYTVPNGELGIKVQFVNVAS